MGDIQAVVQKLKRLSRREREVFQERCQGKSIADIAATLVIVESTVKHHLGNIYAKLELDHLHQAARNLEIPKFCGELSYVPEEDSLLEPEPEVTAPHPMSLVPVLEDELALVQQEQGAIQAWSPRMSPLSGNQPFPHDRQRSVRNFLILLLITALLSGLAGAGIMALIFTLTPAGVSSTLSVASPAPPSATTLALSPPAPPPLVPTIPPTSASSSILINDTFADAFVIDSFPYSDSLNLTSATIEVGEPLLCSFGKDGDELIDNHTVWYRFTPTTTIGLFTTMTSELETSIIVYSGSRLDSLTKLGCITGGGEWGRMPIPITFTGDTTYYLQIGGIFGGTVDFQLESYVP